MNDSPIAGCLLNYLRELALGLGTHRIDFDLIGVLRIGSYWRWLIGESLPYAILYRARR